MRRAMFLVAVLLVVAPAPVPAATAGESAAVKAAALDYIEGWYEADAGRMERALHPDLAKRAVFTDQESGEETLQNLTAQMMIDYTRKGGGSRTAADQVKNEVQILDLFGGIATVKVVSADYVDYLHLAKWHGQWKIVNVLWAPRSH